jgi:hypothetical protein
VCEETEKSGDGSQNEGNNMQDKSIREPFDNNLRNLNVGLISYKFVDIKLVANCRLRTSGAVVQLEAVPEHTERYGAIDPFYGEGGLEEVYRLEPGDGKGDDGEKDCSD